MKAKEPLRTLTIDLKYRQGKKKSTEAEVANPIIDGPSTRYKEHLFIQALIN